MGAFKPDPQFRSYKVDRVAAVTAQVTAPSR